LHLKENLDPKAFTIPVMGFFCRFKAGDPKQRLCILYVPPCHGISYGITLVRKFKPMNANRLTTTPRTNLIELETFSFFL